MTAEILTAVVTFIVSVSTSAFIGGVRVGIMQSTIQSIDRRLSAIEAMFRLTLKKDE
jgi:hypothetical protein